MLHVKGHMFIFILIFSGFFFFYLQYSSNRMNLQNIGIVLSPTMNIGHGVLFIFLSNVSELFPDTQIAK